MQQLTGKAVIVHPEHRNLFRNAQAMVNTGINHHPADRVFRGQYAYRPFALKRFELRADMLNGLMAIPNLIALLLLSPVVFKLTRAYFDGESAAQNPS